MACQCICLAFGEYLPLPWSPEKLTDEFLPVEFFQLFCKFTPKVIYNSLLLLLTSQFIIDLCDAE